MIEELIDGINHQIEKELSDGDYKRATASQLGLDPRAFYGAAYVSDDCIAIPLAKDKGLQYYGGFEYIDQEFRTVIADWVFYQTDGEGDDRVQQCIDWLDELTFAADAMDNPNYVGHPMHY